MGAEFWVQAQFWLSLVSIVVAGAAAVYAYLANRYRQQITELEDDVDDLKGRVTKAEQATQHAPTHKDLGDLYDRLNLTNNALSELTGKLGALTSSLARVENYLLNQSRGHRD